MLFVVVFPLGAVVLYRTYVNWTAKSLLQQAAQAESKGNLKVVAECLQSYVHLVPGDMETLARYGLLCARRGESIPDFSYRALGSLERALVAEPNRHDIRRIAAEVALRLGQIPRANAHAQTLLKTSPDHAEAEVLLGKCQVALEKYRDAAIWFDRACKHAPDRIENYVRLAHLFNDLSGTNEQDLLARKLGRRPTEIMNEMVAANPHSAHAYLERARYRQERSPRQRRLGISFGFVEDDLARAYKLAPEDIDVLVACAEMAVDTHHLDKARTYLEKAVSLYPQDGTLICKLADVELHENRIEAAIRRLHEAVERLPENKDLAWTLADVLIQAGELEKARQIVNELRDTGAVNSQRLGYLESGLLMREGDWMNAAVGFESLGSAAQLRENANYWLSRCYKQLGDLERQLGTIQALVELKPRNSRYQSELGFDLLALGSVDEAIIHFREVTNLRPDLANAWLALARLLILRELRLPESHRHWLPIERLLDHEDRLFPNSSQLPIVRANLFAARRQVDRAYRVLEDAKAKWPDRVECWIALAEMAPLVKRSAEAPSIFDEAQRRLGDSVDIRLGRARYWAAHPGAAAQDAVMNQARDIEKFSGEDRRRLLDGLAVLTYRIGLPAQAERLWSQIADLEPGNLRLRLLLFELAFRASNQVSMDRIRREIERTCESLPHTERTLLPAIDSARSPFEENRSADRGGANSRANATS